MATLLVTFGKRDGPLEAAADALTYSMTISGEEQNMVVPLSKNVVTFLPDSDCWVAVGNAANAESADARRPLAADAAKRFSCRAGQVVSVIQRA